MQPDYKFSLKTNAPYIPLSVLVAFLICILYWGYLFLNTRMEVIFDAVTFENAATLLLQEGWAGYFKDGPTREPLYPILIAGAMKIASYFSISYYKILTLFQLLILLITQGLLFNILKKLDVRPSITAVIILYFGCSPAMTNSALSLFSEILMYPFVLGIILMAAQLYVQLEKENTWKALGSALLYIILFIGLTATKSSFQFIYYLFLLPFTYFMIKQCTRKNWRKALRAGIILMIMIVGFQSFILVYKLTSKKYNGSTTINNQGPYILYGTTVRRMQPLTLENILACVAYNMGDNLCKKLLSEDSCASWNFLEVEHFGSTKRIELLNTMPLDEANAKLIPLSVNLALTNPLQYGFITLIDNIKFLFWESTKIGGVTYPLWLKNTYDWPLFKNTLRLAAAILTFFGLICLLKELLHHIHHSLSQESLLLFFMLLMILAFIGLHSFFAILTRYIFPIVPLYGISIGLGLHTLRKNKTPIKNNRQIPFKY